MTQAERTALRRESDIKDYFLGSVLSGGGSAPPDKTAPGWAEMYDRYQSIALQTRLRIPLLYGVDAVHGHNNVVGAVIFPHNIGLGCTRERGARRARRDALRPRRSRPPASTGRSRPASPSRATSAGDAPTRASARRRSSSPRWARPRCAAISRRASSPAPSTTSPTAARRAAATRATPSSTRRLCEPSTCPATARRSRPAPARSWSRSAAGTVRRCTATGTCSPTCSRASWASPASSSATGPASTSFPATTPPTSRARSTPASTW